nr:sugar transferase [Methylobacterium gossipiicola]
MDCFDSVQDSSEIGAGVFPENAPAFICLPSLERASNLSDLAKNLPYLPKIQDCGEAGEVDYLKWLINRFSLTDNRMNAEITSRLGPSVEGQSSQGVAWSAGRSPATAFSKRCFDLTFAVSVLLILLPLFGIVAAGVKLNGGGPIFFRHQRVGRDGHLFGCLKFRTMRQDSQAALEAHLARDPAARQEWLETRKLKNDPRVTAVGVFLRKTSLDELPQLLNILAGHMSVVGPRPIVPDEIALYGTEAGHYLAVRPGLTGAWQVSGRSDTSYAERVRLDSDYVKNWTFANDLSIVARTVPAVFMSRGSY